MTDDEGLTDRCETITDDALTGSRIAELTAKLNTLELRRHVADRKAASKIIGLRMRATAIQMQVEQVESKNLRAGLRDEERMDKLRAKIAALRGEACGA